MKFKRNLLRIGIICFICFVLGNIFFPISLFAQSTADVYLEATTTLAQKGEEVEIVVQMKGNKTAAFELYLSFDPTKVEYISGPEMVNVQEKQVIFVWYDEKGGKGAKEGEIARFRFHVKEEGIANFTLQGDFYNSSGEKIDAQLTGTTLRIGEEEQTVLEQTETDTGNSTETANTKLQTLRIDTEGMIPEFDTNVTQYYLTVGEEINEIEVLASPENPKAKVNVTGNSHLKEGANQIQIEVTAKDGNTKRKYVIDVTKTKDVASANTNLETLAIEGVLLEPAFDNTVLQYRTEIPKGTNFLNMLAIPEDEKATVTIEGKENLQEGDNLIKVTVLAQNKITKKVVEITVHKRNEEEEEAYQQERKEEQKQLEAAYEIEKTSTEAEEREKEQEQKEEEQKTQNTILTWIIAIIIVIGVIVGIWYIRRKHTK